ncbi:MAG: hypothetical protein PHW72_00530 [Candidatus Pacebacteria bacterium]|nr:hypothetical protein [Candidatus Paceibacterota bacterium]
MYADQIFKEGHNNPSAYKDKELLVKGTVKEIHTLSDSVVVWLWAGSFSKVQCVFNTIPTGVKVGDTVIVQGVFKGSSDTWVELAECKIVN